MRPVSRRFLLFSSAAFATSSCASARVVQGSMPWTPDPGEPPVSFRAGPWAFFTAEEGAAVEAMTDRLIPPDDLGAGGREAGCAVYIDRQLAGPFGHFQGYYMTPPFADGLPSQGMQSDVTPAARYRTALAAVAAHCSQAYAGKIFRDIPPAEQDRLLSSLETGVMAPPGTRGFFALLLSNTMEGFFADPLYGGNRDLAGWKLIGFAGARYDHRDWVGRHNEPYDLPPVGITGRPAWIQKG